MKIVIAARDSKWALAATKVVADAARAKHPSLEVEVSKVLSPGDLTPGDLAKLGGTTSFVDALSRQVALGRFDAAVHTVKDISWPRDIADLPKGNLLPTGLRSTGNLVLAAITKRNDPRDALVCRPNETVASVLSKKGAKIGTSSLVRAAAFESLYGALSPQITPIRGNIDARIEKLDRGEYDLLILSMDGLIAVGQESRATEILSFDAMMPALGQGFGAAETRDDNEAVIGILNSISQPDSVRCLRAEWALMRALQATCMTPIAGICSPNAAGGLTFASRVYGPDGETLGITQHSRDDETPEIFGERVARALHELGAETLTARWRGRENGLSQDAC